MSPRRAYAELCLASALWGFGFIATLWAMESFSPLWLHSVRYALVVVVGLPFWLFLRRGSLVKAGKTGLLVAAVPGLALGATLLFQTYGLKYTTVTKSGFLTTLYVVIVPLLEAVMRKRVPSWMSLSFVLLALLGTALMTGVETGDWNVGDLLTLACTLCATVQIISIGRLVLKLDPFDFNFFQSVWSGIIPIVLALSWEPLPHAGAVSGRALAGILFLTFGSTFLGFHIQIRAQRVISPSLASFFFLLESPFAAFFAYFFLGDRLRTSQWLGALLIFTATAGTALSEHRQAKAG